MSECCSVFFQFLECVEALTIFRIHNIHKNTFAIFYQKTLSDVLVFCGVSRAWLLTTTKLELQTTLNHAFCRPFCLQKRCNAHHPIHNRVGTCSTKWNVNVCDLDSIWICFWFSVDTALVAGCISVEIVYELL